MWGCPKQFRVQREAVPGLVADWPQVVSAEGLQLMTVGHHFRHSRPLNEEERGHIDRGGVCLSCHQEIPSKSLAVSLMHHIAEYSGKLPKSAAQHNSLLHNILLIAGWGQIAAGFAVAVAGIIAWLRVRRRGRCRKQDDPHD